MKKEHIKKTEDTQHIEEEINKNSANEEKDMNKSEKMKIKSKINHYKNNDDKIKLFLLLSKQRRIAYKDVDKQNYKIKAKS